MTWKNNIFNNASDPDWLKTVKDKASVDYIHSVLNKYKGFNFVQRILNPTESIPMPTGRTGTHFMVWAESDGRYVVYPRIVKKDGELQLLDETEAWNWAKKTGEMIPFRNKEDASWFSTHYKDVWKGKYQEDGKSLRKY